MNRQTVWLDRINEAKERERPWRKKARTVLELYRDEKRRTDSRFNVLYSNTEILRPAVFSQIPRPDVRPRLRDDNKASRVSADIVEKVLVNYADGRDFSEPLRKAVDDMLLPGRGVVRVKYAADFSRIPVTRVEKEVDPESGETLVEGGFVDDFGNRVEPDIQKGDRAFIEDKSSERVFIEHVLWDDFLISDHRKWEDVDWIAFRVTFSKSQAEDFFGKKKADDLKIKDKNKNELEIWEVWNKPTRERLWISETAKKIIEKEDDPLGLSGFFPIPAPLYAVRDTGSLVPVPLYKMYQDQAVELDEVVTRLADLTRGTKLAGIVSGEKAAEIKKLENAKDGQLVPVKVFDKPVKEMISWVPVGEGANIIAQLMLRRDALRQEISEISGISDILTGATKEREPFKTQRLKASSASMRLRPLREQVEEMVRDLFRIMGEIVVEKFSPETVAKISGYPLQDVTVALEYLSDQRLREFRIDVETDSTVRPDLAIEKQELIEFMQAFAPLFQQVVAGITAFPPSAPLLLEILGAVMRQYNLDPKIEDKMQILAQQVVQVAAQPQPSETEIEERAETERVMMREQSKQAQQAAEMNQREKDRLVEAAKIVLESLDRSEAAQTRKAPQ